MLQQRSMGGTWEKCQQIQQQKTEPRSTHPLNMGNAGFLLEKAQGARIREIPSIDAHDERKGFKLSRTGHNLKV